MSNLNFNPIDPNKIVLQGTPWYNSNDERLGNLPFENIRSYVKLTMKPKNANFIQIDNGTITNTSSQNNQVITLGGFYEKDGVSYYSTNYTDEIMGDNTNPNKSYEGFGIKNIDITFDANKIPQVTVVFYDVRGNVINDFTFSNKYAKMFQLPYPIFELTIKGGFGPTVSYRLLKIKDNISIDELGNYIITSNFIGDRFAPLSDLPLLYLNPVPFLRGTDVNIFDNQVGSFFELMQSSKRLYEKVNSELQSDEEVNNEKQFQTLNDERTSLVNKLNFLKDKQNIFNWFSKDEEEIRKYREENQDIIRNYIKSSTFEESKIVFNTSPTISLSQQLYESILLVIDKNVKILNDNDDYIKLNKKQKQNYSQANQPLGGLYDIAENIDFSELIKKINEKDNQIIEQGYKFHNDRYVRISNLPNEVLGSTKLTIGTIFKFIFDDYNFLMNRIWEVGKKGYESIKSNARTGQVFDRMGFPTVIQDGKMIYPGQNQLFKDWDEVVFIEQFIDAYYQSIVATSIADSLLNKTEDGGSKYIPINPREVYKIEDDGSFNKENNITNVYFGKTPSELYNLIYERFLCFSNINIDLNINENIYSTWNNNQNVEKDWTDSVLSFFGLNNINENDVKKGIFFSIVEAEARNIAYAITLNDDIKKDIRNIEKSFSKDWFKNNKEHLLTKGIKKIAFNVLNIPNTLQPFNDDYVTVSDTPPSTIDAGSQDTDIITTFMKGLNDISNSPYKVTKDNVLYLPDKKLNTTNNDESDYDDDDNTLKNQLKENNSINTLFNTDSKITAFNLDKIYTNCKYPALIQIPRGILILLGSITRSIYTVLPSDSYYKIPTSKGFIIIKNQSKFFDLIFKESVDFDNNYGFSTQYKYDSTTGRFDKFSCDRVDTSLKTNEQILEYIYQTRFLSINDFSFTIKSISQSTPIGGSGLLVGINQQLSQSTSTASAPNTVVKNGITDPTNTNQTLYVQYLKVLLPKVAQFVKDDDNKLKQKLKSFSSYIRDPDVKLSIYKSFQVIYENYLHGSQRKEEFELEVSNNESSSFIFVDRGYNNISGIDGAEPGCILDIKTLLNDVNDYEVSLFSSISRLLADNNFWFYPFANFLTTTEKYEKLFTIDYDTRDSIIKPKFVAMYVGGLSSNPNNNGDLNTFSLQDDGIKKNAIPRDLYSPNIWNKSGNSLNAFLVRFTGLQNQSVFSNLQVSTESLKNTDEGLRIQSEIVSNGSNSYSIPKGQSLLNVYQKQSYSSTVKIPFGNMGIQPTQYYYQEYMPLFDGLYIVYNVTHSIDADNQRLETTFKGYRLKKDTNPIVTQQFVDFLSNDIYTQGLNDLGFTQTNTTTSSAFNPSDDLYTNARRFIVSKEGYVGHCYWDIDNWRIGYGNQVLALNSSLKAAGNDRFNDKHFKNLPKDPTRWPSNIDLDSGSIAFTTLQPTNGIPYVTGYNYYRNIDGNVQWDAARKARSDHAGLVKDFYSRALADKAADKVFHDFAKQIEKINPTGFNKLTDRAKIAVTYISYGFGSIEPFMTKIRAAIASGSDTQVAIALIEDLAIRKGNWSQQSYYDSAKYIDPDIFNKLSNATKAALKDKKFKIIL